MAGFPSDRLSLPNPTFLVWSVVIAVCIAGLYAGFYILLPTIISLYRNPRELNEVHPLSIVVLGFLMIGYPAYSPFVSSFIQWIRISFGAEPEGFLVQPRDPAITTWVITRKDLMHRIKERYDSLNPPFGIQCGTCTDKDSAYWEPSKTIIHQYVQRVSKMYISEYIDKESLKRSKRHITSHIRRLCEERSILEVLYSKLEIETKVSYSYNEASRFMKPLLEYYTRHRKHYPRLTVDEILGVPLGQVDPQFEAINLTHHNWFPVTQ